MCYNQKMIFIDQTTKQDPVKRWALDDKTFFAAGACQVLAYAFLETFPNSGFRPLWIRPYDGYRGNHIIVTNNSLVFDYQGITPYKQYFDDLQHEMSIRGETDPTFQGWAYTVQEFPKAYLISEQDSKAMGLWLRQPDQFLHNALPRAFQYLERYEFSTINNNTHR